MGLDMFLYQRKNKITYNELADTIKYEGDEEIGYWRKFNALHALILDLTGSNRDINCEEINLSTDVLAQILDTLKQVNDLISPYVDNKRTENYKLDLPEEVFDQVMELLPPQPGFFWGPTIIDAWYADDVVHSIVIFERALKLSNEGEQICYYGWW